MRFGAILLCAGLLAAQTRPAGVDLSGVVRIDGDTGIKPSQVRVFFTPSGTAVNENGAFTVANLPAGVYHLRIDAPEDLYLKAVRCDADDATDSGVDLTDGSCEVAIVLGIHAARIEGQVRDEDSRPAAGATVTLVAPDSRREDLFKTAVCDTSGHFKLAGIAPGSYRLYAWDKVDADAVKRFGEQGTSLDVSEGDVRTVNLSLIRTKP